MILNYKLRIIIKTKTDIFFINKDTEGFHPQQLYSAAIILPDQATQKILHWILPAHTLNQ